MDISNWPINQIMQLPDWCFGERWPVSVSIRDATGGFYYDISEFALPERFVIWEYILYGRMSHTGSICCEVRLGDKLPITAAQYLSYERLFKDLGLWSFGRYRIGAQGYSSYLRVPMRMVVSGMGRRLVGCFVIKQDEISEAHQIITISSVPKSVPDYLDTNLLPKIKELINQIAFKGY